MINILKNAAESVVSSERYQKEKLLIGIIDIKLTEVGDTLVITVLDTGLGLDPKQNNYFEPYVTTKKNGTGLGLSIVNKIINDHNGKINFTSIADGAKVQIYFDLNDSRNINSRWQFRY